MLSARLRGTVPAFIPATAISPGTIYIEGCNTVQPIDAIKALELGFVLRLVGVGSQTTAGMTVLCARQAPILTNRVVILLIHHGPHSVLKSLQDKADWLADGVATSPMQEAGCSACIRQ